MTTAQHTGQILSSLDTTSASTRRALEDTSHQSLIDIKSTLSRNQDHAMRQLSQISGRQVADQELLSRLMCRMSGIETALGNTSRYNFSEDIQPSGRENTVSGLSSAIITHEAALSTRSVISFKMTKIWKCQSRCKCTCHAESTLRSPSLLRNFLGMLSIGYTAFHLLDLATTLKTTNVIPRSTLELLTRFRLGFLPEYFISSLGLSQWELQHSC